MPYIYINPLAKGLPTKQDPWSGGVWITHWCERTYWCSLLNSFTAVISIMQPLGGCFQCAQSCMCRPVPWVAQRWSYRARIEDGSCRFIDPPTLCPTRSLSPSSRRTVADSAQFYQPLLQKRNHCLDCQVQMPMLVHALSDASHCPALLSWAFKAKRFFGHLVHG